MKVERIKKNIVAKELASPRFHQRVVQDKTKYNRRKENKCEW